jgi:hypothetical protein
MAEAFRPAREASGPIFMVVAAFLIAVAIVAGTLGFRLSACKAPFGRMALPGKTVRSGRAMPYGDLALLQLDFKF